MKNNTIQGLKAAAFVFLVWLTMTSFYVIAAGLTTNDDQSEREVFKVTNYNPPKKPLGY